MRLSPKIKWLLLSLFCCALSPALAQKTFKYQAFLKKVDSTGFYKIILGPDIVRKSKEDLADIRVADPKGNYIPYVTAVSLPHVENQRFIIFPQITTKSGADTGTSFTIKNTEKLPISTLWINLNNTAVVRSVNLLGSDDLGKWYAIEEDIPLQQAGVNSDGTYLQSLSFPASKYQYFKLLVNDKKKAPVKILEVGQFITKPAPIIYLPITATTFLKKDTDKLTRVTVKLKDNYLVNRLRLSISAPKYYNRRLSIYSRDTQGRQLIASTSINPATQGDILLSAKTSRLEIEIDNGDNSPLTIDSIKAYQAQLYIVSYLEKGKLYNLCTGNANAEAPVYDLKFFTDSIWDVREIGVGPVMKNAVDATPTITAKSDYTFFIWAAIAIVLLLLTMLTLKMAKEVNKKI